MLNKHAVKSDLESYLSGNHSHTKQAHFGAGTSLFWRGVETGRPGESSGEADDGTKTCVAADPLLLCDLRSSPASSADDNWTPNSARPSGSE